MKTPRPAPLGFIRVASGSLALLACAACALGCGGGSQGPATGRLTVDWTINGAADPNLCTQSSATTFDLTVYDDAGGTVGAFRADCEAFAMTIDLAPGGYTADARLLDPSTTDRTTTIAVNPFRIVTDTDLSIALDFPASSFR